ncbi:MAG: serine hydrolase domain-containing protein [Halothermotrichaceae bacterium]
MSKLLKAILVVILMITFVSTTFANPFDNVDIGATLDKITQEKMEENNIPNLTIAVVKDGEMIYSNGYGYEDIENKIEVRPDKSLFRIGSISKLFTFTAVMQLYEKGLLDLDTDVNEYLNFEIPPYKEKGQNDSKPITLAHLLTHRPGFEDNSEELFYIDGNKVVTLDKYLANNVPERIFPAGEIMAYSNYGAALAGSCRVISKYDPGLQICGGGI